MGSVLVFGSSNTDLVLGTDELPQSGQTVLGHDFYQAAGGKGANQAVAAARAGADVVFVGAVGADEFGNAALEGLRREGIDIQFVRQIPDERSGVAMIMVDREGRNLIGVAPGANACVDADYVRSLPDALFEQAALVVCQLEIPREAVQVALHRARQSGAKTVLNPAPPDRQVVTGPMLTSVDILVLNEHEAVILAGCPSDVGRDWDWIADQLHARGPSAVVLTLGEHGFFLSAGGQRVAAPSHPVRAVDTVGAGDTFVGVLSARLAEGASLVEAAKWANAASALSVTQPGAQPSIPNRAAIQSFMESINVGRQAPH